jgi:hypothetical protein
LLEATFFNPATGQEFKADWFIITQYLFQRHFYISGVVLLMTVMTFVLGGFLTYHIWLTSVSGAAVLAGECWKSTTGGSVSQSHEIFA